MKPSQRPFWTLLAALLLLAGEAQAALYLENFSAVNTAIPDGSPIGVALGGAVSDIPAGETVEGLAVSLDLRGGYNANLYAYLVGPNGTLVVLMNQPGVSPATLFGAGGAGMAVTLLDGTSDHGSIQNETSGGFLTGSYNAAGHLADFNGSAADGTWRLFLADLVPGGGQSTLTSWSLGLTTEPVPVPEPGTMAVGVMAGLLLLIARARARRS